MNTKDYQKLKADAEEKCRRAIAKAKNERDATITAIERVWRLFKDRRSRRPTDVSSEGQPPETVKRGDLTKAISDVLPQLPNGFTLTDVIAALTVSYPSVAANVAKSSISGLLRRLADAKRITELTKGAGRKPSTYSVAARNQESEKTSP